MPVKSLRWFIIPGRKQQYRTPRTVTKTQEMDTTTPETSFSAAHEATDGYSNMFEGKGHTDEIGDKVKGWEGAGDARLDMALPLVVRLDGCAFHTYTRVFRKPCDPLLYRTMIDTTLDLVQKFGARVGYTESDEITLVFVPSPPDAQGKLHGLHSYRVQKLCSVMAGYASARFNFHAINIATFTTLSDEALALLSDGTANAQQIFGRMKSGQAFFDARAFNVPTNEDAALCIYWRHHFDCHRNSVAGLGQAHFSHQALHGKGTGDILGMLREKGVVYNNMPPEFRFGTFVKRRATFHDPSSADADPKSKNKGDGKPYMRTTVGAWSERWEGGVDLIATKYVNQNEADEWLLSHP